MQVFEHTIEAVCDCGANVSCLSPKILETLKSKNKIELRTCDRKLRAANGLPIEVRGVIRVPVKLGTNLYVSFFACWSGLKQIVCLDWTF